MASFRTIALTCLLTVYGFFAGSAAAQSSTALDRFNDWAYGVNHAFLQTVVSPVLVQARALPEPAPQALRNAFDNLTEPVSALSHIMSGDPSAALESTARFALNSTIGVAGMIDVAGSMGLPGRKKHFSEGVCALGLPAAGPVVIMPIAGPTSAGIAAAAIIIMAGSTWVFALVSVDLAVVSALSDVIGAAAALENTDESDAGAAGSRGAEAAFRSYLSTIGC